MSFIKGLRAVRIYYDDELIGKSEPCYVNEPMMIKIPQRDIDIEMKISTNYIIKQNAEDDKWYLYADGVKVCEVGDVYNEK